MEKVIQLLGTLIAAFGFAWMIKRVLRAFTSQTSSIKVERPEPANTEVKLYRRGLPELPYRQYRTKPMATRGSAAVTSPGASETVEAEGDLTILAAISEHFDKAEEFASVGYFEKAIDELNFALALEPGNAYIYEAIGDLYMELVKHQDPVENLEAAISCYRHAIGLQSDAGIAYYKLGIALERRGFKAEAREYLGKAQELGIQRDDLDLLLRQLDRLPLEDKLN